MALPTSLAYMQKPSAIASRSMRSSISPVNGATFRGGEAQTIRLEIPTGVQGQFLNPSQSWLRFSVATTGNANTFVDKSIYGMFSRLVISHNGVVLEQIDEYGPLANAILDFQVNESQIRNDMQIMLGTDISGSVNAAIIEGIKLGSSAATKTYFNMPLLSSLFSMQSKYLPIGDIQNELRIELTLNPNGFHNPAGESYDYEVTDVEMFLDIVELDPAVASAIRKETLSRDGAFKIPLVQWRNYSTTIAPGSVTASLTVPAKMNSLKNILVIQRDAANVNSKHLSKNIRINGDRFDSYWFQIGSQMVPPKPVREIFEAYQELQRSFHDLSVGDGDSILNRTTYPGRKFMIGLELESLSHRSDVLNSGLNTMSTNIYFNPTFKTATPTSPALSTRVDFYCHYDAMLMVDATGQCNVVF